MQINNSVLSYLDIGKGKPIIFLPSWPLSGVEFLPLVELLKSDYKCICIDIPGWLGDSTSNNMLNALELSSLVNQFIHELDIKSFALVGYSLGGLLALNVASTPEMKIDDLFIISSPSDIDEVIHGRRTLFGLYRAVKAIIPNIVLSRILVYIFRSTTIKTKYYRKHIKVLNKLYSEISQSDMKMAIESMLSFKLIKVRKLAVPINILVAENDPKFVHRSLKTFKKNLTINSHEVIPNEDHNHVFFAPEYTARFIRESL